MALFEISGNELVVGTSPLVIGSYDVSVITTDQGGLSFTKTVTAKIIATNPGHNVAQPIITRRTRL